MMSVNMTLNNILLEPPLENSDQCSSPGLPRCSFNAKGIKQDFAVDASRSQAPSTGAFPATLVTRESETQRR